MCNNLYLQLFFESSAKTTEGISEVFEEVVQKVSIYIICVSVYYKCVFTYIVLANNVRYMCRYAYACVCMHISYTSISIFVFIYTYPY